MNQNNPRNPNFGAWPFFGSRTRSEPLFQADYLGIGGGSLKRYLFKPHKEEIGSGVLRVAGNDLNSVDVRVELAGDAVYEADGAPHEEQVVRDVADARA